MKIKQLLKIIMVIFLFSINNTMFSQTFVVTKFELDNNDMDGSTNWVKDLNGNKCALIKIVFKDITIDNLVFEPDGNIFIKVIKNPPSQIWVYVPAETKRFLISTEQNGSKNYYNFPSGSLYATKTYNMEIELNFSKLNLLNNDNNKKNIPIQEELVDNELNFLKLISSNKKLVLDFNKILDIASLSNVYNNPNIEFRQAHDGQELVIKNVENLEIVGKNINKLTEIITKPEYGFVMVFENCKNISLSNLNLGHGPERGHCTGGVLKFENCENIKIKNSILYGSGTTGIEASKTTNLFCDKININTCTYNILVISECNDVLFSNSTFSNNEQFDLINIGLTINIKFDNCIFENNFSSDNLFNISNNQQSPIDIFNSKIINNKIKNLSNKLRLLNLKQTKIENNINQ